MIPYCVLAIENDDDREFMTGLVETYKRLIYSTILKITKKPWDVEEIYQTTWENLIDKIQLLRSRDRNRRANYMISTAHNTALNYVRDNKRTKEFSYEEYLDTSDFKDAGSLAERHLIKREELSSLSQVWLRLDERSKFILEGYYVLEKSMAELAQELGIKPGSVRMALTRARRAAYKLLEDDLDT